MDEGPQVAIDSNSHRILGRILGFFRGDHGSCTKLCVPVVPSSLHHGTFDFSVELSLATATSVPAGDSMAFC